MNTTDTRTAVPLSLRASNSDRERISTVLHDAAAQGMLTLEEVEERLISVYAAKFRSELEVLVADLPVAASSRWSRREEGSPVDHVRAIYSALVASLFGALAFVGRHRRITAAVIVIALLGIAALAVFGSLGWDGHEAHQVQELGER